MWIRRQSGSTLRRRWVYRAALLALCLHVSAGCHWHHPQEGRFVHRPADEPTTAAWSHVCCPCRGDVASHGERCCLGRCPIVPVGTPATPFGPASSLAVGEMGLPTTLPCTAACAAMGCASKTEAARRLFLLCGVLRL
ncbi:MAG: hypothetical protein D6741_04805 [Planctomycetota bacterium]|nr:MAG: hypothetical protein D6741_04805 [Planctomycetota bacterium]